MSDSWNGIESQTPHTKAASYNSKNKKESAEELTEVSSAAILYQRGVKALANAGFYLKRDPLGYAHCGHTVYVKTVPKPTKGIDYPLYFRHFKKMDTPEEEEQAIAAILYSDLDEETKKFWQAFTNPLSGDKKNPLDGYVSRLHQADFNRNQQNESEPVHTDIQLTNFNRSDAPVSYIPPREWFDPEIQKLKFTDIVTIFPDAESEMMELIIGRICFGRSGITMIGEEGIFDHTFRSVAIIVGEDPGLGKSTIFNKLFNSLNRVGYKRANFREINAQFGLGNVVDAAVAYKDDLTEKSLSDLIKHENTKIIASGGWLNVEQKYQAATNVRCNAVIVANTNTWNPREAYGVDSGVVSRVALLSTLRANNIESVARPRLSPQLRDTTSVSPFSHIPWVAQKLGVSEEALMLWVCRLAVDAFRPHVAKRGEEVQTESLRLAVHHITSRMVYTFNKHITKSTIQAMVLSHCLIKHLPNSFLFKQPYTLRELNREPLKNAYLAFRMIAGDRRLFRLRALIKAHWEIHGRPDAHPWSAFRKINLTSLEDGKNQLDAGMLNKRNLSDLVKSVFGEIFLRDGFQGSTDLMWVTKAWESVRGDTPNLEKLARLLFDIVCANSGNPEEGTEGLFSECLPVLGQQAVESLQTDLSWMTMTEDYSPQDVDKLLTSSSRNFDAYLFEDQLKTIPWII